MPHTNKDKIILTLRGTPEQKEHIKRCATKSRKSINRFVLDALAEPVQTCKWTDRDDCWTTECLNYYSIIEGTPKDNKMEYCCFCGRKIT